MNISRLKALEKVFGISFCVMLIELVIFKYIPDIGSAYYQGSTSPLASFEAYSDYYMLPGSVHHARFLGNLILWHVADFVGGLVHSSDVRLHPLRLAAAILTPLYFIMGLIPAFLSEDIDWKSFIVFYMAMFFGGMYVFYPCDAPSLAGVSWAVFFLMQNKYLHVLCVLLITGLFRESAFHVVVLSGIYFLAEKPRVDTKLAVWVALFAIAFIVEYAIIRLYFPGPVSVNATAHSIDLREMFFGKGLWSLTSLVTLMLLSLFPLFYMLKEFMADSGDLPSRRVPGPVPYMRTFFRLNCAAIPFWIIFYRAMGGNMTEFRIFWPTLIPVVYGIAYFSNSNESQRPSADNA